jgi:hypothetical protein
VAGEEHDLVRRPLRESVDDSAYRIRVTDLGEDDRKLRVRPQVLELVDLCLGAWPACRRIANPVEAVQPGGHDNAEDCTVFGVSSLHCSGRSPLIDRPISHDENALVGTCGHVV